MCAGANRFGERDRPELIESVYKVEYIVYYVRSYQTDGWYARGVGDISKANVLSVGILRRFKDACIFPVLLSCAFTVYESISQLWSVSRGGFYHFFKTCTCIELLTV